MAALRRHRPTHLAGVLTPVPRHDGQQARHAAETGEASKSEPRANETTQQEKAAIDGVAQHHAQQNQRACGDLYRALAAAAGIYLRLSANLPPATPEYRQPVA